MTQTINITDLTNSLIAQLDAKKAKVFDFFIKSRDELLANTDPTKTEELLRSYQWAQDRVDRANEYSLASRISAAKLFNQMARELEGEFASTEIDMENYTIKFTWFGNTLSFPLKMLASRYNLHAGMFGFESSFTTHEAYTEDNYLLHIGIARDDDSAVLVSFGKLGTLEEHCI